MTSLVLTAALLGAVIFALGCACGYAWACCGGPGHDSFGEN